MNNTNSRLQQILNQIESHRVQGPNGENVDDQDQEDESIFDENLDEDIMFYNSN